MRDGDTEYDLKKCRDEHENQRELDARLDDNIAREAFKIAEADEALRRESGVCALCAEVGGLQKWINRREQAQQHRRRKQSTGDHIAALRQCEARALSGARRAGNF